MHDVEAQQRQVQAQDDAQQNGNGSSRCKEHKRHIKAGGRYYLQYALSIKLAIAGRIQFFLGKIGTHFRLQCFEEFGVAVIEGVFQHDWERGSNRERPTR